MNRSYMNDFPHAGKQKFKELCQKTHHSFEISGYDSLPLTFAGLTVSKRHEGFLSIDQTFYLGKLECLESTSSFSNFRSIRMRVAWIADTRPDLQFEISRLAEVTGGVFKQDATAHIKRLDTIVRYAHEIIASLPFPKLDLHSIRIVGYSDAAFANNHDDTSQLGLIILLVDDGNAAVLIKFKSY